MNARLRDLDLDLDLDLDGAAPTGEELERSR
jgi:hypothetical protein